MFVDAGLNYFFLRTVKQRLVKYHGLTKYAPLVRFNARLMVLSVAMDVSPTLPNRSLGSHTNNPLVNAHLSHVPEKPSRLYPVSSGCVHG